MAQIVAGRVVGRTEKHQFGLLVGCSQQVCCPELEMFVKLYFTVFHIVDVGTNLIHAVSRIDGYYIVCSRPAEDAVDQVNAFIASVTQEDLFLTYSFNRCDQGFQLILQRIRIAVVGIVIRIFVGVQKHGSLNAFVFIACR